REQISWMFQGVNRQTLEILLDMAENFSQGISLNSLAEKYHFSSAYLSRMIKKETGYSFSGILNAIRLAAAVEFLLKNHGKINLICDLVGFSDQKYFSQVFKKTFGCSPGEFRRQGREQGNFSVKKILEMSENQGQRDT
ncbi:MAG TPA: AraC family transcriptional regulator, partial [Candidatus Blautia pullicola]|nr:AraC family transcriptional regulator [Candidatus Blautia pullicola]